MVHRVLEIRATEGLRAQPAAAFVQTSSQFSSQVLIERGNKKINAKSVMGVLSLNVQQGDIIHILVNGPDEKEALKALTHLVENDFEMDL